MDGLVDENLEPIDDDAFGNDVASAFDDGYQQAIADVKEKVNAYATIWMSYTDDMSKEQIANEALKSAKSAMIRILDSLG